MMVKANPGLAQHTIKSVFGAIIWMIMAADIAHPAGGLTQRQCKWCFILKKRRGPGEKRRRHRLVAPEAERHLTRCRQQRVALALGLINQPSIPTFPQAIGAEDDAARTAGA